ncbi:hypothetical protein [Aeromonas sp. MdU4]|uniref:hypothetical protein n=1 Tax=Aeromonas sp. MdU4 TaxID=3342819 RepID=UPI0035B7FE49
MADTRSGVLYRPYGLPVWGNSDKGNIYYVYREVNEQAGKFEQYHIFIINNVL